MSLPRVDRRTLLLAAGGAAGLAGQGGAWRWIEQPDPQIYRPGMADGHWLREQGAALTQQLPDETLDTGVAILGSGVAGLSCAWQLARAGFRDVVLVQGPERDGNCAAGQFGALAYPRGAHYLPLPSMESRHVRDMLHDTGVLEGDPYADAPVFDEMALVHAPEERLLKDGRWHDELLPMQGIDPALAAEHQRFHLVIHDLSQAVGRDGKKAFAIPRLLSSSDPAFVALDALTMRDWLVQNRFESPWLRWYCDYACRDDYGIGSDQASAWAGLHYFASRGGRAANADPGAVLTWPNGLGALSQKLRDRIKQHLTPLPLRELSGMAIHVQENEFGTESLIVDRASGRVVRLRARQVVLAMPLMVAARILAGAQSEFGLSAPALPTYAPWLVGNVLLEGFPREREGSPLAWDNVIYGSPALGYVVSTHQQWGLANPRQTVFTTYRSLHDMSSAEARRWLLEASPDALWQSASEDLRVAYPRGLWRHVCKVEITVRGHAMSSPRPGLLMDRTLQQARQGGRRVHFAHADLSGLSVFEEASYWGCEVAKRLLGC